MVEWNFQALGKTAPSKTLLDNEAEGEKMDEKTEEIVKETAQLQKKYQKLLEKKTKFDAAMKK